MQEKSRFMDQSKWNMTTFKTRSHLLTDEEAAPLLNVSPATLRSWRCRGVGPTYVKLGRGAKAPVRYSEADIEDFVSQCRHVPPVRAAQEN
jgi:hypothetical protein